MQPIPDHAHPPNRLYGKVVGCEFLPEGVFAEDPSLRSFAVPVVPGSVLHTLHRLVEFFVEETGWSRGTTTALILTGAPPNIPRATGRLQYRHYGHLDMSWAELRVHPTTAPSEVAAFYRRLREMWREEHQAPRQRRTKRPLGTLVEFRHARRTLPWQACFDEWNRTYPDAAYTALSNMQRDHARALRLARSPRKAL